jgi:hypothetical protein
MYIAKILEKQAQAQSHLAYDQYKLSVTVGDVEFQDVHVE